MEQLSRVRHGRAASDYLLQMQADRRRFPRKEYHPMYVNEQLIQKQKPLTRGHQMHLATAFLRSKQRKRRLRRHS